LVVIAPYLFVAAGWEWKSIVSVYFLLIALGGQKKLDFLSSWGRNLGQKRISSIWWVNIISFD